MRKDSDFEVMDNIKVAFSGNATVAAIAERNKAEIMDETLAVEILFDTALTHSKEWSINGETVTVSVEKI
jgi:isoleucyl-tRNA synthetase